MSIALDEVSGDPDEAMKIDGGSDPLSSTVCGRLAAPP
jgi:hypothetical protein